MKKRSNLRGKKSPDMVLHKTFHGTKAVPVSSATQGLTHKLRTLSVPVTDIRKDDSLRSLGLEDQGHGVWRFKNNTNQIRYHRHIRIKGNREEISSSNTVDENPISRVECASDSESLVDGHSDSDVAQSKDKKTCTGVATKVIPGVINLSVTDDENINVCDPPVRVKGRKMRLSSLSSVQSVEKRVICGSEKNRDNQVETEVQSSTEGRFRSGRNQQQNCSLNENDFNVKSKKASRQAHKISTGNRGVSHPLNSNGIKIDPKVIITRIASPLKRGVPRYKSSLKGNDLKGFGEKDKALSAGQMHVETQSEGVKQYRLRSVTPSESEATRKRKREDSTASVSYPTPKLIKTRAQETRSGLKKRNSNATTSASSSKQEKNVGSSRKKCSPRKWKKNTGSKKGVENDLDFKVSRTTSARNKVLPKLKLTRKHQSKFQMQWCEICGVELHSLDNKLEHEFSHLEPRQLFVSLHRCHLNCSSVKLPMYVSSEDLASIPCPQEDNPSPIPSDDASHPLFPIDNVLNEDEENAYESHSSSDDESESFQMEYPLVDDSAQESPVEDPNGVALGDAMASPAATPERSTPVKSPRLLGSRERSKRKSQVKMRLWDGPPVTRSGRVIKVTQKTKECMEQLACVRVLFSENEVEGSGSINTALTGEERVMAEKLEVEKIVEEEKLIPLVDDYVEIVGLKEDLKDIVESSTRDLESVTEELWKGSASTKVDQFPAEEIKACSSSVQENSTLETEEPVLAKSSSTEKDDMPLQNEEVNGGQKEKDVACILSGDVMDDGLLQDEEMRTPESATEKNHVLENHASEESSALNEKALSPETKEIDKEQNDEGCILPGDLRSDSLPQEEDIKLPESTTEENEALEACESVDMGTFDKEVHKETNKIPDELNEKDEGPTLSENTVSEVEEPIDMAKMYDVMENVCKATSDMNQNVMHEVECDETSEKQSNAAASEMVSELPEGEVSLRLEDSALSSSDVKDPKVEDKSVLERKISESDTAETVPERDSADQVSAEGIGIGGLFADAIEENSKDIMLVDESNDAIVAGALSENVEMQESSEAEFVSVPNDIDISKFNTPEHPGLEDITDDEWSDISDKEMQQSPQYVNGHIADIEMDEEGPVSGIDNVVQDGEMDLEEIEKDPGLPDPMCTGEVVSETLEEEMKDVEVTEDEIMSENVVDEMVGMLSPKESVSIADRGEPAAEVDMTEAVEDAEDGCMAEASDIRGDDAREDVGEVGDKGSANGESSVDGRSSGVILDILKEGKVMENEDPSLPLLISEGENNVPKSTTVEDVAKEVPVQSTLAMNAIELLAVLESGGEQDIDSQGRLKVKTAETCRGLFAGGSKDEGVGVIDLKDCELKVRNDLYATNINMEPNKVTLGCGNNLPGSN
ncbi:uro-adherence factor A-like [Hetaerina americana]|uniref:uro-adherence factor A-like n=1 Tax=Hetaerina americana TaxID=62018 RepID=UPI003A7F2429